MATLNIRNLPDEIHYRLRLRAAKAARSMEAEARAILEEACKPEIDADTIKVLHEWVDELYGANKPTHVVDDLIAERRREAAQE